MRTVDPVVWSKKVSKPPLNLTRPMRFGQKAPSTLEACLRLSFSDAINEFWLHCSVITAKRVNSAADGTLYRHLFVVSLAVTLLGGVCVVWYNSLVLRSYPAVLVNLVSDQHAIGGIPFPAIALCSNNVINKTALMNYTLYLEGKDRNHSYSRADIQRNLLAFASLVTLALPPVDVMFTTFLDHHHRGLNVSDIMFRLAPQCSSQLQRCSWAGQLVPCESLFAMRITSLGYCCVFNGRYIPEDENTPPKILNLIGQENGLSIVFKENTDEFGFLRRPVDGLEVLMFDGSDYPLLEGGGLRLYPIKLSSTVYLSLSTTEQHLAPGLRHYSEDWRGCRTLVNDSARSAAASYAWCLTECRRRSMRSLCHCLPYSLPPARAQRQCTPLHLSCLNKHREKFVSYYPSGSADAGLGEEAEYGQDCGGCRPHCAARRHGARARASEHHLTTHMFHNYFLTNVSLTNAAVIHIFYPKVDQQLFAVEAYLYGYERAASLISQWMCLLGVPIVTLAELVFHLTVRWGRHFVRRHRISRLNHRIP